MRSSKLGPKTLEADDVIEPTDIEENLPVSKNDPISVKDLARLDPKKALGELVLKYGERKKELEEFEKKFNKVTHYLYPKLLARGRNKNTKGTK